MTPLSVLAVAMWGAVGWRLRGGAFTGLTGVRLGTDGARLLFGGAWMVAPAAFVDWRAVALIPALVLGMMAAPWGGYMALGRETTIPAVRAPYDAILRALGFRRPGWVYDAAGLLLCGFALMAIPAVVMFWLSGSLLAYAITWAVGFWLPGAYALAYALELPLLGKFIDDETVWGECFFGAALAPALFFLAGGC